jgi:glycosyltransferase involved in cell wall biosynthesis
MNILVINNPKVLGGMSKSLILLIQELKKKENIDFYFFVSKGQFEEWLKKNNFNYVSTEWISQFDNTRYGYYRGKRWLILIREIYHLPVTIFKLLKLLKNNRFDLVIINDAPLAIYSILIKKLTKSKVLLYVRSVQNDKKSLRTKMFEKILMKFVDSIIAIDFTVKKSLPKSVYFKTNVIHNGFYRPNKKLSNTSKDYFGVGFLGVIYDAKGYFELLEAIKILVYDKKIKDIKLFIAGHLPQNINNKVLKFIFEKLGFFKDYYKITKEFIDRYNLNENVQFLGYVENLEEFFKNIDLLVFPSKLNAVGRPVFEAGFYNIPSIVAVDNPSEDTFINMQTGISIKYPDPLQLSEKIELLYKDPILLKKLGEGARKLAEKNFGVEKNSNLLLDIIKQLIYSGVKQ